MTTVLKLGGSVITVKARTESVDEAALERAAAVIGAAGPTDLVVVHGGGSFGHHHAEAHGVGVAVGTHDVAAVTDVHDAMRRLNDAVVSALQAAGVDAVPVHPFSLAHRAGPGDLSLPAAGVRTMLREGFVPVLHGDMVAHADRGATVLSGDEIVVSLAASLGADRVGLCSTVPGVLDADGSVIERIDDPADVEALGDSDTTDVTGGMAGKVRALLDLETTAHVFDLDSLAGFLDGERPGTAVGGGGP